MNPLFLNKLADCGNYSSEELEQLEKVLQYKQYDKGKIILEQGIVCSEVNFILKGSTYQYTVDENSEQHFIDLHVEGDWFFNPKSFSARKPSESYIVAFEDTQLLQLSITAIHELIAISPSFLQMGKILETANHRVIFFDKNYTPDQKYKYLLREKPELVLRFPQKIIASYLKITPETLSRVRSRIHKL